MKDMMALAAERAAKVLGKVVPGTDKPAESDSANADALSARAASSASGKKERHRD